MHGREKSDLAIVTVKPANNDGRPSTEPVERRAGTEGNAGQDRTRRAQDRESVSRGWTAYARCKDTEDGTVHLAPPPRHARPAPDGLLRPQATGRPRRGRADVAGLR